MYARSFAAPPSVCRLIAHAHCALGRDIHMPSLTRRQALGSAVALLAGAAVQGCSVGNSDSGSGTKTISFLTFETPNLTPAYWDAAIKRITDKYPDIKVNKLVAPTADGRTDY